MAWSKNGTPTTLGSALDDIDITDLTAKKFNVILEHLLNDSGQINQLTTLDDNGNTDYAQRKSSNGGADATATSQAYTNIYGNNQQDFLNIIYSCNIDGEEKLSIQFLVGYNNTGAASAPERTEAVWKVDTTTNSGQYTRIDINNTAAASYATNSNLSVLGTD